MFYRGLIKECNFSQYRGSFLEALGDLSRYWMAVSALIEGTHTSNNTHTVSAIAENNLLASSTPRPTSPNPPTTDVPSNAPARIDDSPQSSQAEMLLGADAVGGAVALHFQNIPLVGQEAAHLMGLDSDKSSAAKEWFAPGLAIPGKLQHHLSVLYRDKNGTDEELHGVYHFVQGMVAFHPFFDCLRVGLLFTNVLLDGFKRSNLGSTMPTGATAANMPPLRSTIMFTFLATVMREPSACLLLESIHDGRPCWQFEGVVADKVARWKEDEQREREMEDQWLRGSSWQDNLMEVDDADEMLVDDESEDEDDEADTEEIRQLKVRRRYLETLLEPGQREPASPRHLRGTPGRKPEGARQSLRVVPRYTVLVADTNILLSSLVEFLVVVPLPVIVELDSQLNMTPLGEVATAALRYITSHIRSHSLSLKVQTSRGNYLTNLNVRTEQVDFSANARDRNMDDLILAGRTLGRPLSDL
ncbi:hypothetical protein C8Q76DRAFT_798366 [Earliella scabrosa]|nr:hypothetical protein C8Q76DRAFT_798366 [Earliella scabrosa]